MLPTAADVARKRQRLGQNTTNLFTPSETPLVPQVRAASATASSSVPQPHAAASAALPPAAMQPTPPLAPLPPSLPPPQPSRRPPPRPQHPGLPVSERHPQTAPQPVHTATAPSMATARGGAPATAMPANTIVVSHRQQGNPVLKRIVNVPWQYGETSADYVLSETTCALFLSLRYHLLHPNYLTRRLLELSNHWTLRLVLVLVDSEDAETPLLEVTKLTMREDCTVLCAWSVAEAARYLETLRAYAKKPADLIKERTDGSHMALLAETLKVIPAVNKPDVHTLQATFGSLAKIMRASHAELLTCPGLGERKVRRLRETFTEPFVPAAARALAAAAIGSARDAAAKNSTGLATGGMAAAADGTSVSTAVDVTSATA